MREIEVAHPAAKNMIELSRTQDEECGDGTTSVIILGVLHFPFKKNTLNFLLKMSIHSRRNPRPLPPIARTQHPPSRNHLRLQQSA